MSAITIWLDSQPSDPSDYEFEDRPHKRRRSGSTSELRRQAPRQDKAPTTPPRRSSSGPGAGRTHGEDAETARAAPSMISVPSSVHPYPRIPLPAAAPGPAARSPSPVRGLRDLHLSDVRVHAVPLAKPRQAPEDVRELCRDIQRVGQGNGLLPRAVKGRAAALLDDGLLDDLNFDNNDEDIGGEQRAEHERFWAAVHNLMDAANECEEARLSDADWNNEVHSRALRLALECDRSERAVWYRNVTTARVKDRSLLPASAKGQAAQSKMVDFAIVLDASSDEALAELVRAKLRHEELPAINHTPAEHVRFSPIATSIETKRAAIREEVANARLAVWASAHFRWLRRLSNGDSALPTLPLVIVQGHEWRLMLAELRDDSNIRIYRYLNLGTTTSVLGVYQLVASLRRLAEWAKGTYRPWLEKNVLLVR